MKFPPPPDRTWPLKIPVTALALYVLGLLPLIHGILPQYRFTLPWIYPAYLACVIAAVLWPAPGRWRDLGLDTEGTTRHLAAGLMLAGPILLSVPLLDGFIDLSGLAGNELFQGAGGRAAGEISWPGLVSGVLLRALLEQAVFNGLLLGSLLKKIKPAIAVYLAGLAFPLVHFNAQLGLLLMGWITAALFFWTGRLYAGMLFQTACHATGVLILLQYPRVLTLLGFLF